MCFGNDNDFFSNNKSNRGVVKSIGFKVKLHLTLGKLFIKNLKSQAIPKRHREGNESVLLAHHSEGKELIFAKYNSWVFSMFSPPYIHSYTLLLQKWHHILLTVHILYFPPVWSRHLYESVYGEPTVLLMASQYLTLCKSWYYLLYSFYFFF